MVVFSSKLLSSLLVADSLFHVSSVSAFTTSSFANPSSSSSSLLLSPQSRHTTGQLQHLNSMTSAALLTPSSPLPALRIRGGGRGGVGAFNGNAKSTALKAAAASAAAEDPAAKNKNKRVRIDAFDSMRFVLILNIVLGHFIMFANPSDFLLKFVSQSNASVGAFFALSGYVAAYTSTENAQRAPSPKLTSTPSQKWILQRIFGYYPLHLFVLLLFSPVFIYTDLTYNGLGKTIWNGILSVTLLQSWFPLSAESWNAPTWYLSALNWITAVLPFSLVPLSKMTKPQLRKAGFWLFAASLLPKLGYFFDLKALTVWEGITAPKAFNYAMFNVQRFSPLFLIAEVLLGVVACRIVMLDNADDEEDPPKTNALSTLTPLGLIVGAMYLRAANILPAFSDLLFRTCWLVPLFLRFLMAAHRNTVRGANDLLLKILSNPLFTFLGNLSFPIYIVHGPIGYLFFKKLIASKLFGGVLKGPQNFGIYLATTMAAAYLIQKGFLQNKKVSELSGKAANKLAEWF